MNDFEKLVHKYYNSNSDELISNGSIEHATILAKYLFLSAEKMENDVKIITGSLDKDFYAKFAEPIKRILKNNTVSIISEKPYEQSDFSQAILDSNNGNIKTLSKKDKITSLPHFILIGDSSYRLETDDNLKLAQASFNRPNVGKFLLAIFNTFYTK